jgi:outer membrane protein TolC
VLISNSRTHTATYTQGTLTGGSVSATYTDHYLNENSPTDVLNPSVEPNLTVGFQHNLLRGFGIAVNARTITVQRINLNTSEVNFRTRVSDIVAEVLNAYYNLSAAYDDLRAKRSTAEVARTFEANVREQIEIGSIAPTELIGAQTQAINSAQAVIDDEVQLDNQQDNLKLLISRNGTSDPVLRNLRIVPVDRIEVPVRDDLPGIDEMVQEARANRTDLTSEAAGVQTTEISALGTKNGVLPTSQVFYQETNTGLAGNPRIVPEGRGLVQTADPYFVGGTGNALGQIFRNNFPTRRAGAYVVASIGNRQAQADNAIDDLTLRQTQLRLQKDRSQVEVDVLNYVIALRQARARYEAAVQNRKLQEELFASEQKKYSLGASVPYNVIRQQQDLDVAQSNELAAKVTYSNARVSLERTLGRTLETNHVSIAEARAGVVSRPSNPPPAPQ